MNSSIEKESKMKNKVKYIMTVSLVALAGCTDLDVDIKSQYTEYPSSSDVAVEAKMADVYYAFRSALGNNYNRTQTLASDEASGISFDADYYDGGTYCHPTLHNFMASDGGLSYWSDLSSAFSFSSPLESKFTYIGNTEEYSDDSTLEAMSVSSDMSFILTPDSRSFFILS